MSRFGLVGGKLVGRVLLAPMLVLLVVTSVAARGQPATPGASPAVDAPVPVEFPRDEGPHPVPIEWWYFTGHLFTEDGDRYGFEVVVFKRERGGVVAHASHAAVTDTVR